MTSEGKDAVVEGGTGAHGTLSGLWDQVARRLGKGEQARDAGRTPADKRPLIAYFGPDQRDSAVHRRIAQWRQLDEPHTVVKALGDFGGKLYREPCLSCAWRTNQRDHPLLHDQRAQTLNFLLAIDERRQLYRDVKFTMG